MSGACMMYSTRSNKIDGDQVYEAGRYYTGLWKSFHRYPRWETNIDFTHAHASNVGGQKAFEIRATDGQIIGLELTIQYRLKKTGLLQIYKDCKFEYEINLAFSAHMHAFTCITGPHIGPGSGLSRTCFWEVRSCMLLPAMLGLVSDLFSGGPILSRACF